MKPAKATRKIPAVLVIHEDRGLNPYIKDVARRVAKAGFMALAPDGLTSVGGYPGNDADGKVLQKTVDRTKLMNDFLPATNTSSRDLIQPERSALSVSAMAAACAMLWPWPTRNSAPRCRSTDARPRRMT